MRKESFVDKFIRGFSYAFLLNVLLLISKIIYSFFLPKLLSVESFGYWQLYFLYAGLIHFCHLGLVDGIYLVHGGRNYSELNKRNLGGQFGILVILGFLISTTLFIITQVIISDLDQWYVILIVCIDIIFFVPRALLSTVFQMTGMIKKYSYSLLSEVLISFFIVVSMLFMGVRDFKLLILGDCIARIGSLIVSIYNANGGIRFLIPTYNDIIDSTKYIKIGVFLLFSNMISILTISSVRLIVESAWGIQTFSFVSLALSISNILIFAIGAASIVLFPILKRVSAAELAKIYNALNYILFFFLSFCLLMYYPISLVLVWWLPKYSVSFYYLGIVAPMCLFEMQLSLVGYTCMKILRKEKSIFSINIKALCIILILCYLIVHYQLSVEYILILLILQAVYKVCCVHYLLNCEWEKSNWRCVFFSVLCAIFFELFCLYIGGIHGFLYFLLIVSIFFIIERSSLWNAIKYLRSI